MFEFLVEKETEARKLSETEANKVATDVEDLWEDRARVFNFGQSGKRA